MTCHVTEIKYRHVLASSDSGESTRGVVAMKFFSQSFVYECVSRRSRLLLLTPSQRSLVNRLPRLLPPLPQPICRPRHLLRRRRPQTDRLWLPSHNEAHSQAWITPPLGPTGHHLAHRVVGHRAERGRPLWQSRPLSHQKPRPCQGHADRRVPALSAVP